jgi:hypothetical protein
LPPEFKKTEGVFGIDSYVEEYTADGMKVTFDYGHGVSFPKTLQDGQTKALVGCKKAIISRHYYAESPSPMKLIHAIDFYSPRLTLWVEYAGWRQEDDALRILYSVRVP